MPDLSGQRVLITGGLGFIGSNLARRCLELGAETTIYDCLDPRSGGNMFNVSDIEQSLDIVLNDVRNFESISAAIRGKHIVFNCAAYTSHPNSMKDPLNDVEVNCKGVINLLEAARRFNAEAKIVHIGTSTQIGKMHSNPVDEWHPEFPVDIYSANKSVSEKYVLIYGNAYGMRTTVVRLANVYGPRSNIKSPEFGFMNYFIGLGLQAKMITVYGDGLQLRNVSFVEDAVSALVMAATNEKSNGEVFFATADQQYCVAEITKAIAEHIGGTIQYVEWPRERKAIEIGDAVISNARIKSMLNWQPVFSLTDGLVRTRDFFRPHLGKYL